jgi:DNA-binding LytR/AlgR family response regulator
LDAGNVFDIFMLDVYIGNELGTTLARAIRERGIESPVVFITTSVEHAPQCYETETLRYLVKPIKFHNLQFLVVILTLGLIKRAQLRLVQR